MYVDKSKALCNVILKRMTAMPYYINWRDCNAILTWITAISYTVDDCNALRINLGSYNALRNNLGV